MAQMRSNVGARAQSLARLWGREFGNPVFKRTLGMMKNYLCGNKENGTPAYSHHQIEGCIKWLAEGQDKINKPIMGAGVIADVIQDFIAGKSVEETWLGYKKPSATVRML